MRVVIIGAGMAGLACARGLAQAGHTICLMDKGRGPGGRMSTRRVETGCGTLAFDHGAQYFTARDPAFIAQVEEWAGRGLVARWPAAAADAWVGTPGMSAPVAAMAAEHEVRFSSHVMGLVRDGDGWRVMLQGGGSEGGFDAAVVALPAEQAAAFLGAHDLDMGMRALGARSQPCWTMLAGFDGKLPLRRDVIRGGGALSWAARNDTKPMRPPGEAWVVQADGSWSAARLEHSADEIAGLLLAALRKASTGRCAFPEPTYLTAHRWRYAMAAGAGLGVLWNGALRLGACGDWLLGPRVELAWISGTRLAGAMAN